jgi:hypothetical protein
MYKMIIVPLSKTYFTNMLILIKYVMPSDTIYTIILGVESDVTAS